MSMKKNLKYYIKNCLIILEGWLNYIFPTPTKKQVAQKRLTLCRQNLCGYWDPKGQSPEASFKGTESCGVCGCPLATKTMAMSSTCALKDIGKKPVWGPVKKVKK